MQRTLVKYFNEKKSMAVKMKIQGDLQLCSTLLTASQCVKVFCDDENVDFFAELFSSQGREGETDLESPLQRAALCPH